MGKIIHVCTVEHRTRTITVLAVYMDSDIQAFVSTSIVVYRYDSLTWEQYFWRSEARCGHLDLIHVSYWKVVLQVKCSNLISKLALKEVEPAITSIIPILDARSLKHSESGKKEGSGREVVGGDTRQLHYYHQSAD